MHLDYWDVSINNSHFVLLLHINHYWTTSSLKDLIFALRLNTITSSKICSHENKIDHILKAISSLNTFLRLHAIQVSKTWFLTHQPQPDHRVQLSISHTPTLRQVQANHQCMKSESLCESPHHGSPQHQHWESHAPGPPQHTSPQQSVFALSLTHLHQRQNINHFARHLFILTIA